MIYLDNSATSRFKPYEMMALSKELIFNSANAGRSGYSDALKLGQKIYLCRENVKRLVNANDDYEVIYTSNCTEALNQAILGYIPIDSAQPFHIITTMNEHNSVLRPIHYLEQRGVITVSYLSPDSDGVITSTIIDTAITPDTKMLIINHTSNVTGATCELHEIAKVCKSHNIVILVDAAQSLGHTTIDVSLDGIDMIAGAGHKGLHGLQGVGFLVMRKDIKLTPLKFGGTGTMSDMLTQPTQLPEALESGTLNSHGIITLNCGVMWTMSNFDRLHQTYRLLSSELIYGLRQISGIQLYSQYPSSVISFNVLEYSSTEVADYLADRGFSVRGGLHCAPLIHQHLGTLRRGAVRVSLGYNNSLKEIKLLLCTLEQLVKLG